MTISQVEPEARASIGSVATVIAFDVNETLLDLRALDEAFEEQLGSAALRAQWFAQMLQLAFLGGLIGQYVDFTTAQRAALAMVAERAGRPVSAAQIDEVVNRMRSLPPHPEVPAALERLRSTPLHVVALTNSVQEVADAQVRNADIDSSFDRVISADSVRRLKPAPEPYHAVARAYGVEPAEVRLVAAHSWDVSGALAAGCQAAFVARPGMVLSPLGAQPDIVEPDIARVVDRIISVDLA
jgi:2-haloacid dehalogenase